MKSQRINIAQQLMRRIYARWDRIPIYPECGDCWSPNYAIFIYDCDVYYPTFPQITPEEILKLTSDKTVRINFYPYCQEIEIYRDKEFR